jgi:hypothetical protein
MKAIVYTLSAMILVLSTILVMHIIQSHTLELECTNIDGVTVIEKDRIVCVDKGSLVELIN